MMMMEKEEHSFSNWKVTLPLIKTVIDEDLALKSIHTIVETISVKDIPDVMHWLWFQDYLFHSENHCQNHACRMIQEICVHFDAHLSPLLAFSHSDGSLINFEGLNIFSLLKQQDFLLKTSTKLLEKDEEIIYRKSWYDKQRKRLNRLITSSHEVYQGMKVHDLDECSLLEEQDLLEIVNQHEENLNKAGFKKETLKILDEVTCETWFARLFRYLIVNWLHEDWSYRLGSIKGIEAILRGLSHSNMSSSLIPDYLLEDIVSVGMLVLVKDHFIDYDSGSDYSLMKNLNQESPNQDFNTLLFGFSPVKERVVDVIMLSVRLLIAIQKEKALRFQTKLFSDLLQLNQAEHQWTVRFGGLLGIGSYIRYFPESISLETLDRLLSVLLSNFHEREFPSREILYLTIFQLQLVLRLKINDLIMANNLSTLLSNIINLVSSSIESITVNMLSKNEADAFIWTERDPILSELIIWCLLLLLQLLWRFALCRATRTDNLFELITAAFRILNNYHYETPPSCRLFPFYRTRLFLGLEAFLNYLLLDYTAALPLHVDLLNSQRKELLVTTTTLFYFTSIEYCKSIDKLEDQLNIAYNGDPSFVPIVILTQARQQHTTFHLAQSRFGQTMVMFWKLLTHLFASIYHLSNDQAEDCLLRLLCQVSFDDAALPSFSSSMIANDLCWEQLQSMREVHKEKHGYPAESIILSILSAFSQDSSVQRRGISYLICRLLEQQQKETTSLLPAALDSKSNNSVPIKRPRFQIKIASEGSGKMETRVRKGKEPIVDDRSLLELVIGLFIAASVSFRHEEIAPFIQMFRSRQGNIKLRTPILQLIDSRVGSQCIQIEKDSVLTIIFELEESSPSLQKHIPPANLVILVARLLKRFVANNLSNEGHRRNVFAYIYEAIDSEQRRNFYDQIVLNLLTIMVEESGDDYQGYATLLQWLLQLEIDIIPSPNSSNI